MRQRLLKITAVALWFAFTCVMAFGGDRRVPAKVGCAGPNVVNCQGASGPDIPAGYHLAAVADFNGDGYPDYVIENDATGDTFIMFLQPVL